MRERDVGDFLDPTQSIRERSLALEESAVLDRERSAVGRELEQLGLLLGELTRRQGPDVARRR